MKIFFGCLALFLLGFNTPLAAQDQRPHAEAVAACEGLEAGAECRFESPRGPLEGQCKTWRGSFHCVPKDRGPGMGQGMGAGPGMGMGAGMGQGMGAGMGAGMGKGMGMGAGMGQGPPAESIKVCQDRKDGEKCSFESRHMGAVSGTCQTTRQGHHCMPTR